MNNIDHLLPNNKQDLLMVYSKYGDIKSIATVYGLPKWFVEYELEYFGIIKPKPRNLGNGKPIIDIDLLRAGLRIYKSISKLADVLQVDYSIVRNSLLVAGIFVKAWKCTDVRQWREDDLRKDINRYDNIIDLAKKYKCHKTTMRKMLNKFDIVLPDKYFKRKRYSFSKSKLIEDYKCLGSYNKISQKYNCSIYTIWKAFNDFNIDCKSLR